MHCLQLDPLVRVPRELLSGIALSPFVFSAIWPPHSLARVTQTCMPYEVDTVIHHNTVEDARLAPKVKLNAERANHSLYQTAFPGN